MPASGLRELWYRDAPRYLQEAFDGVHAIFDPATGETHFLAELPALILTAVDNQPATPEALMDRLIGSDDAGRAMEQQVSATLQFLAAAELVESTPSAAN